MEDVDDENESSSGEDKVVSLVDETTIENLYQEDEKENDSSQHENKPLHRSSRVSCQPKSFVP